MSVHLETLNTLAIYDSLNKLGGRKSVRRDATGCALDGSGLLRSSKSHRSRFAELFSEDSEAKTRAKEFQSH